MNIKTISQGHCTKEQAINFTNENPFVTLTKCLVLFWSEIKTARRDEGLPVWLNIKWPSLETCMEPRLTDCSNLNGFEAIQTHVFTCLCWIIFKKLMCTHFLKNDLLYLFFNNPHERNSIFICHCGMTPKHQKLWGILLLFRLLLLLHYYFLGYCQN